MGKTFYDTLCVKRGAHPAEIELAFSTLSKSKAIDPIEQIDIAMAYQVLIHPSRRAEYDSATFPPENPPTYQKPVAAPQTIVYPRASKQSDPIIFACKTFLVFALSVIGMFVMIMF